MSISNPVTYSNQIPGSTDIPLVWTSVTGGTPDEGSLLVVAIHHSGTPLASVPSGWTLGQASVSPEMSIFWKIAVASESDATWTMSGANQAVLLYAEFTSTTGWPTTPTDVGAAGTLATSATSVGTGTTGTTSQADALAIAGFATSGGADAVSPSLTNSFTSIVHDVSQSGQDWSDEAFMASKVLSATGTQTTTLSWSSPSKNEAEAAIVVFLPTALPSGDYGKIIDMGARQFIKVVR